MFSVTHISPSFPHNCSFKNKITRLNGLDERFHGRTSNYMFTKILLDEMNWVSRSDNSFIVPTLPYNISYNTSTSYKINYITREIILLQWPIKVAWILFIHNIDLPLNTLLRISVLLSTIVDYFVADYFFWFSAFRNVSNAASIHVAFFVFTIIFFDGTTVPL